MNDLIEQRRYLFATYPNQRDPDSRDTRFIVWGHPVPCYSFAGRELAPNYIEALGFRCPRCEATVMRSKRPLDLGAGIKLVCISCQCTSIAVSREFARANPKAWESLLEDDGEESSSETTN